jgi:hypothetical protein
MCNANAQTYIQKSSLVKKQSDGRLFYKRDGDGFLLPDFSYAGYHKSEVALPIVDTVMSISAIAGDNTSRIQAAISQIAALPKNANGFRGALLLKAGNYEIKGSLEVNADGIVLRGEGQNTILTATGNSPADRTVVILGTTAFGNTTDDNYWTPIAGTKQNITDDVVKAGALSFFVADASQYNLGDAVIIHHPCTSEWVEALGGGGSQDLSEHWTVGQVPIYYRRNIAAMHGNRITVDAPIYYTLNKSLSQSYIYKTDAPFVCEVGIENLKIVIQGSGSSHAKDAVRFRSAENAWAKDVVVSGFSLSGFITESARQISVLNCQAISPIAPGGSGYKYNFNSYAFSQLILFKDCYAQGGRHNFISNGTATSSGIVFQNCVGDGALETSEGHRHWTQAMLFDNHKEINIDAGNALVLGLYNRNKSGSGHGYGAAQSVLWNCNVGEGEQSIICLHQPPTSQNYAIGCIARILSGNPGMSSRDFPEGFIEYHNIPITDIVSLYAEQLADRLANGNIRLEAAPNSIDADILGYSEQSNLIEEHFNGAIWAAASGGDSVLINILNIGTGYMHLSSAVTVNATQNNGVSHGFSQGMINLNGADAMVELPKIPSCGSITVNVKCNSGKMLIVQKYVGDRWGTIAEKYISENGDYESFTFHVNETMPVKLRLNSETTSGFNIYDLIVTDFIFNPNSSDTVPADYDNAPFLGYVDFSVEPGIFKTIGSENNFANGIRHGFNFQNVVLNPNKAVGNFVGSVILQNFNGILEIPKVKNAGNITVAANFETADGAFYLQKKNGNNWENIATANYQNENIYTFTIESEDSVKLRIVNTGSCEVEIFDIVVEPYSNEENIVYYSQEIVHEQFNTTFNNNISGWTDQDEGNHNFDIAVAGEMLPMYLTNCIVSTTSTQAGASSTGRVRFAGTSSIMELPEIPSCGVFAINVNAGTATGKSVTLQKYSGNEWSDLKTFSLTDVPQTLEYMMEEKLPVKLRLMTKNSGAKNIYELWITNYDAVPTENEDILLQHNLINTVFYNLVGIKLNKEPEFGIFIKMQIFDDGKIKVEKISKR